MNPVHAREYLERYARMARIERIPGDGMQIVSFPHNYSLTDSPDEALAVASEFVGRFLGGASLIWLDQKPCTHVDLCAESLHCALATLACAAGVQVNGDYPDTEEARKRVSAFGIPGVLKGFNPDRPPDYFLLPLEQIYRSVVSAGRATDDEEVSTRFLVKLRRRLDGMVLKPGPSRALGQFLGEAVGNAMTHGGDDWWVAGYFRRLDEPGTGYCYLTVFNFGDTIAETLQRLPADSRHRIGIEALERYHTEKGLFSEQWSPEQLWTLAGLQPGVSRCGDDPSNGHGTDDMMRFIHEMKIGMLPEKQPRMCILSGHTHIVVDGTYPLGYVSRIGMGERIAFNASNDFRVPPDPQYVKRIKHCFPGTLVSLGFYLEPHHQTEIN